jgi:protein-S-isoprenylcysteine O-methyltransferase Ste14
VLFIKNLLFTIFIPGTVAFYLPLFIARGKLLSSQPVLLISGAILLTAGAGVYAWTLWDFASFGRGTPLPLDAPRRLIVRGLYRYTRNPMYLGVFLAILGWACLYADAGLLLYFSIVAVIVHLFVVGYEEPHLSRTFGTEYEAYRASVARWFPRIWHKSASKI